MKSKTNAAIHFESNFSASLMSLVKKGGAFDKKLFDNDKIVVYTDYTSLMSQYFTQTFLKIFNNFSEELLKKFNVSRRLFNIP